MRRDPQNPFTILLLLEDKVPDHQNNVLLPIQQTA